MHPPRTALPPGHMLVTPSCFNAAGAACTSLVVGTSLVGARNQNHRKNNDYCHHKGGPYDQLQPGLPCQHGQVLVTGRSPVLNYY